MNRKNALVLLFLIIVVIIILILLNFFLPTILEYFNKAEDRPESTKLSVTPVLIREEENIYAVDINFRTLDDSETLNKISAVSFSLTYPRDPNNSVEVVNIDGVAVNEVDLGEEIKTDTSWRVPINTVIRGADGVTVEFAAVNVGTEGFSSANGTTLARIYFKAEDELKNDAFILNFDSDDTVILTKTSPSKNIRGDETDLYYAVEE